MKSTWSEQYRFWVLTLFTILLVAVLFYIKEAISPLIIAGLIAYLLDPFVTFLKKHSKLSHTISVNIVFWFTLSMLIILPSIYLPALFGELETLNNYVVEIYGIVAEFVAKPLVVGDLVIDLSALLPNLQDIPALGEITASVLSIIETISVNFLWLLVIVVVIYYLLLDWVKLREWLINLFPDDTQADARLIYEKIKNVWSGYLRGNLMLMFIVGVVYTIVWTALGLPAAATLGLIIGLLTIIPDVGPAIGAGIASIVALIEGSSYLDISNGWFALLILAIYMVLINLKNILLRPRLFGRSVQMHEGVVFVLIIMAVVMQGILAAIIVIPTIASFGIIGRYFINKFHGRPPFPDAEPEPSPEPEPAE